jgi:UPF0271 protein
MKTVDLNADMGESFGPWMMGNDAALLDIVTSANIACGFHAGDADVMARTFAMAQARGVGLGAHPGFADIQGFGRRRITLSTEELGNLITYQLGAAQAMARSAGGTLRHLKLHGALANMASEDIELARTCYAAAARLQPEIVIMTLAGTAQEAAADGLGLNRAGEIFADRAYSDDATLLDRKRPGAVIHDAALAGPRVAEMVREGAIITASGKRISTRIDTICLHGDTPEAIEIAGSVRNALQSAGITLSRL